MDVYEIKKKELYLQRKKINLYYSPIKTFTLFIIELKNITFNLYKKYKKYSKLIIFIILLFLILFKIRHKYSYLNNLLIYIEVVIWWLILGILSSIGLGCGMHSGVLFLFPHIYYICHSSLICKSLNFDSRTNMWRNILSSDKYFQCLGTNDENVTLYKLFFKSYPYCFIWGVGTALGELPPYLTSYYAAKAKLNDEEFEEFEKDIKEGKNNFITKMKIWMINFIKKYGTISVFLFSCWPNVMFDLCGICCGHFLMPFQNFFIPLLLGKALVKTIFQCLFLIFLFSNDYRKLQLKILHKMSFHLPDYLSKKFQDINYLESFLEDKISLLKYGKKDSSNKGYMYLFNIFFFILITFFFISCINQIAQKCQKGIDEEQLKKYKKNK